MGASGYDHFYIQLTSKEVIVFFLEITTTLEIACQDFQKNINFSRLKSPYYRLAIRKKLLHHIRKILQIFEEHDLRQLRQVIF